MEMVARTLTMRPKSVMEVKKKIEDYFRECDENSVVIKTDARGNPIEVRKRPYTVSGLALALGTDRETLSAWVQNFDDEVSATLARAKLKCSVTQEEMSLVGAYNPQFSIFSFKNNFGWRDKTEIEHSGELSIDRIIDNVSTKPIDGQLVEDSSIDFLEENNP